MYDTNAGARRDWRDEGLRPRKVTVMSAEEAAAQAEENRHSLWSFLVWAAPLAILVGLVAGQLPAGGFTVFLWFGCLGFLLSRILSN